LSYIYYTMDKGGKAKFVVLIIGILLISLFVNAKEITKNEIELENINDSDLDVFEEEIEESNISEVVELEVYEPLDLVVKEIYFDDELILNEELFLKVKLESSFKTEVNAEIYVKIIKKEETEEDKEYFFEDEKEISFVREIEEEFGPIVFEEAGDYEVEVDIKSSIKEKEKENNQLTGSFFFPFLMCEDGTYYDECNDDLLYCENGYLIEKCNVCGCKYGFECIGEECVEVVKKERQVEIRNYIYAGSKRLAEIKNGKTYYYHTDNLGSVRKVSDENGDVVFSIDYYPFGEKFSKEGYGSNYEYTGKEFDDSGLNYYGARYYDSNLGRFITSDPLQDGLNWYSYVGNNPMNRIDPSGLSEESVVDYDGPKLSKFNFNIHHELYGPAIIWGDGIGDTGGSNKLDERGTNMIDQYSSDNYNLIVLDEFTPNGFLVGFFESAFLLSGLRPNPWHSAVSVLSKEMPEGPAVISEVWLFSGAGALFYSLPEEYHEATNVCFRLNSLGGHHNWERNYVSWGLKDPLTYGGLLSEFILANNNIGVFGGKIAEITTETHEVKYNQDNVGSYKNKMKSFVDDSMMYYRLGYRKNPKPWQDQFIPYSEREKVDWEIGIIIPFSIT